MTTHIEIKTIIASLRIFNLKRSTLRYFFDDLNLSIDDISGYYMDIFKEPSIMSLVYLGLLKEDVLFYQQRYLTDYDIDKLLDEIYLLYTATFQLIQHFKEKDQNLLRLEYRYPDVVILSFVKGNGPIALLEETTV